MKKTALTILISIATCIILAVPVMAGETRAFTTKKGNMTIQNVLVETTKDTHIMLEPNISYTEWHQTPIYWIPYTETARVTFNTASHGDVFEISLPIYDDGKAYMQNHNVELPLADNSFTLQVWIGNRDPQSNNFYNTETLARIKYNDECIRIGFLKEGDTKPPLLLIEDIIAEIEATEIPEPEPENLAFKLFAAGTETPSSLPIESPSPWAIEQINAAVEAGIVPENLQSQYTQATTRAEFCALATALYESVTGTEIADRITFNDTNDINVEKMAALGVVAGVGNNNFAPDQKLTREQAAAMLSRLANAMGKALTETAPTFADNETISSWAFDAVGQVQAANIMNGVGENNFDPQAEYTREQTIATMMRLFDLIK